MCYRNTTDALNKGKIQRKCQNLGGTLYIGVPPLQILGGRVPPFPQGLRLCWFSVDRGSSVSLQTARRWSIRRVLDAEVHRREGGPATVGDQQVAGRQEGGRVDGRRGGNAVRHVRTRDAEHVGPAVDRHAEHGARRGAVQQQEVRAAVHRETCH